MAGAGAMGRHHVRLLSQLPEVEFVGLYDKRSAVGRQVAEEFGTRDWPDMDSLADEVEAMVVAVPTVDHADVGCELLEQGRHVLIEKPLAASLDEADRLLEAAGDRVLAVGHVEFFNPAIQRLLLLEDAPGFVEIHRLAKFTPRSLDIDVILDLMIHDLQILHSLDSSPVAEIRATGINVISPQIDIANARVVLDSGCVANITASRVSSERVRKLRVFLPGRAYYSVDYDEQEIKGFRLQNSQSERKILPDDLVVTKDEPLKRELKAFVAGCRGEEGALVDGRHGRQALESAFAVLGAISQQP